MNSYKNKSFLTGVYFSDSWRILFPTYWGLTILQSYLKISALWGRNRCEFIIPKYPCFHQKSIFTKCMYKTQFCHSKNFAIYLTYVNSSCVYDCSKKEHISTIMSNLAAIYVYVSDYV